MIFKIGRLHLLWPIILYPVVWSHEEMVNVSWSPSDSSFDVPIVCNIFNTSNWLNSSFALNNLASVWVSCWREKWLVMPVKVLKSWWTFLWCGLQNLNVMIHHRRVVTSVSKMHLQLHTWHTILSLCVHLYSVRSGFIVFQLTLDVPFVYALPRWLWC